MGEGTTGGMEQKARGVTEEKGCEIETVMSARERDAHRELAAKGSRG